jgi:hypothetical protein
MTYVVHDVLYHYKKMPKDGIYLHDIITGFPTTNIREFIAQYDFSLLFSDEGLEQLKISEENQIIDFLKLMESYFDKEFSKHNMIALFSGLSTLRYST